MLFENVKDLKKEEFLSLQETLREMNPVDIADYMNELDGASQIIVLKLLTKDIASEVFPYLSSDFKAVVIEGLSDPEVSAILAELDSDDLVDVLQELPANLSDRLIKNLDASTRAVVNHLLKYEENTVGSLMTVDYVYVKDQTIVSDCLAKIRESDISTEHLSYLYVVDKTRKLLGFISLADLLKADLMEEVGNICDTKIITVTTLDDQEIAANLFKKYHLLQIPVVDLENRLVGILTADDFFSVIEEEIDEDYALIQGITPSDKPYLETGVFSLAKKRIVWLLFLMLSATLTGFIIKHYEGVLETSVVLAAFIPMLMDSGGNSGSQSSTLIIRSLALDEIKPKDFFKVMWKEFRVGLVCGGILSIINLARIYFFTDNDFMLSLTVSITLLITVIVAKLVGGILPIISKKIGQDPAVMASPLVTTIVDVIALMIYFEVATLLLGI